MLATALTVAGMLFASMAGAAPLVRQMNIDLDDLAIDGSDIYWTRDHMVRRGSYEVILYRGSFLNKSKVELARFGGKTWESVQGLSAGGGHVVVSLENEFFASDSKSSAPTSRVIRMARDGSRREVIAAGRVHTGGQPTKIITRKGGRLNDCGTRVRALSVSATGSVVIGQVTGDRRSKRCGEKKDVDHWRYYEQRLDGSQREIFATDRVVETRFKRRKRGHSWSDTSGDAALSSAYVIGDRALIRSASSSQQFVRDLTAGTLSGPFKYPTKSGAIFTTASMGLNGSLALNAYFSNKKSGLAIRSGVFPTGVPTSFKEVERDTQLLEFCGSHLISSPFDSRKIYELDPGTLAPVRSIGTRPSRISVVFGIELGCNDNFVYGIDLKERPDGEDISVSLLAYPLN